MKKSMIYLIVVSLLLFFNISYSQLKSQVPEKPSLNSLIKVPGIDYDSNSSIFDPNRFFMQHQYSVSFVSSGKFSTSQGMYLNNMNYIVSDKLVLKGLVGFVHNPFANNSNVQTNFLRDNLIYGAALRYRPTENVFINMNFYSLPSSIYSPYNNRGIYRSPSSY